MSQAPGSHHESDEARLLKEEYQIWKKNTPFLYGTLLVDDTGFQLCSARI